LGVAVSGTSVDAPRTEAHQPREGLQVQTLIIAAIASGIAAVVVSHFWARGTIVASAMTPVVVAIVSELLKKPVESERVRGSVRAVSSVNRPRSGRTPRVMAPPAPGVDEGLQQRENGVEAGPVRVYSSGSTKRPRGIAATPRRKLHLKIAVITGLIAFLIAAAALTLPELIFGGSVTGHRSTTYFGGGQSSHEKKSESQDGGTSDGQNNAPTQQNGNDSTSPSDPGASGSQQPQQTTPSSPDSTAPSQAQPPASSPPTTQTPAPAPAPTP
jgi:hypothetical protein